MSADNTRPFLGGQQPVITKDEAQVFIKEVLKEELPQTYPASMEWVNKLIRAFHRRLPFQNVTLLSKPEDRSVPSWEDIRRDVLIEGKGGLCLTLNVAFAAVVRCFGVHSHLVPGDYVATNGLSVHAMAAFHLCTATSPSTCQCFEELAEAPLQEGKSSSSPCHRSPRLQQKRANETRYPLEQLKIKCQQLLDRGLLYLADVGCGFPIFQAINLKEDIDKPFKECGLEYCFIKKGQQYTRVQRIGDDIPQGEERCVNPDGWRPVFSFTLTPQPLGYFDDPMKAVYIDKEVSTFFSEFHAVCYMNNVDMIAIKVTWASHCTCNTCDGHCDQCKMKMSIKTYSHKGKKVESDFKNTEIITFISKHFPMIPNHEVQAAVDYFSSLH